MPSLHGACHAVAVVAGLVAFCGGLTAQDVIRELAAPVNPRSGVPCPASDQYSLLLPDPPGVPTLVALRVFFQDISNLSDVDQTLSADVYVIARWRDHRLADPRRGDGSADCPVPVGKLWMPSIAPENLRARQLFYDPHFLVDASGVVTLGRRQLVQAAYPLDFRDFPIDRHQWKFTLWPTISAADEIQFYASQRAVARNSSVSLQGWRIGALTAVASTDQRSGRTGEYARFDIALDLDRDWSYYAWKLGSRSL